MARISGVNLPTGKKVVYALTYIYGIGLTTAKAITCKIGIGETKKVKDLTEDEIIKIRELINEYTVEGDLKRKVNADVKRLIEVGSYRGYRHRRKLPCRGQRTHTNARTKRGKKVAIAGKKKVTK